MLAYVAAPEVEIDRLHRDNRLVHEAMQTVLLRPCAPAPAQNGDAPGVSVDLNAAVQEALTTLHELRDLPGYHPAFDQVVAVAVRPLTEHIFWRHHRLLNMPHVTPRLALESEHIEWFPARLRIILDNLLCNALKYRDNAKDASWVEVGLRSGTDGYEFSIRDNAMGLGASQQSRALDMHQRAITGRIAGTGAGLAVVKTLVEQSGGELSIDAGEGQGTTVRVLLPHYEIDDFLV